MTFGTDTHVPIRMNCIYFGDSLTFDLAPPSGLNFNLLNTLVYDEIPVK